MFTYPQYDVLIFTGDFDGDFFSVLHEAVFYGNGRLLGNVLGFYFSHHFTAAIFVTAFFLTLIVFLCNRLIFDGRSRYIFPLAVLMALPALGIIREVYSMIAAFSNYAVPVAFALVSANIIKDIRNSRSRLLYIPLALSSACACLFSENTTVVMLCLAVVYLVTDFIRERRVSAADVVNLIFTGVGALIMVLIPRVTKTTENLSCYRSYVTEPTALLHNAISALKSFALLADQYLLIYLMVSALMIFVLFRQSGLKKIIKIILTAALSVLPVSSVFTLCFYESASNFSAVFFLLEFVYLAAVMIIAISSKSRQLIASTIITAVLLCSAIGPMFIVNHRGDRTFFTTFAILLCYALYLVRTLSHEMKVKKGFKKVTLIFMPIAYAAVSLTMLVLCAQNFGAYAFRANYIAEKMTETRDISVPYLAHERLATEKTFNQIDPCLFGGDDAPTYTVISADEWEKADEYKKITDSSPVKAIEYALKSWNFKNPKYPQILYEEYSLNNK